MRVQHFGVALAALVAVGCPFPDRTLGNGGLAIGGRGGEGGPDLLVFTVQPNNTAAGQIINAGSANGVQVTVRDSLGLPDSAFVSNVTIAIGANPVGGILSGTTSVPPVNGVARFGDLTIDRAGSGYTLQATAQGATAASSNPFRITSP